MQIQEKNLETPRKKSNVQRIRYEKAFRFLNSNIRI